MDKNKQRSYEKLLDEECAKLEEELSSIGQKNPSNPADWEAKPDMMDVTSADPNEKADLIESYEENTAILKQLETRFNNVKDALKRIDDGTFGTCRICSKEIEEARLKANPAAETCIEHRNA